MLSYLESQKPVVFEFSHVIFTCLKSTIKTLEKVEKCVQS